MNETHNTNTEVQVQMQHENEDPFNIQFSARKRKRKEAQNEQQRQNEEVHPGNTCPDLATADQPKFPQQGMKVKGGVSTNRKKSEATVVLNKTSQSIIQIRDGRMFVSLVSFKHATNNSVFGIFPNILSLTRPEVKVKGKSESFHLQDSINRHLPS